MSSSSSSYSSSLSISCVVVRFVIIIIIISGLGSMVIFLLGEDLRSHLLRRDLLRACFTVWRLEMQRRRAYWRRRLRQFDRLFLRYLLRQWWDEAWFHRMRTECWRRHVAALLEWNRHRALDG